MITLPQGKKLINLARESISSAFLGKEPRPAGLDDTLGVFVTLNKHGELRGCIGFPEGVFPLSDGVIKAARAAAFEDPRFMPVSKDELKDISIEVSVLSKPMKMDAKKETDYLKEIRVGRDGLIVRGKYDSGLLLPQVAVEYKWDCKTFLEQTCVKAGLPCDYWKDLLNCVIYKFSGQVFSEASPKGEVKRLM